MNAANFLQWLSAATLASSAAIVLILTLRGAARRAFGARAAYWIWIAVPASVIATLLPDAPGVTAAIPRVSLPPIVAGAAGASQAGAHVGVAVDVAMLALWLLGCVAAAAWLARQQWRLQSGLERRAPSVADGATYRHRSGTFGPAVIGLFRPRIVLPDDFETRYDAVERALILAHERMHLRRGDAPANALGALLRAVFWFNPLISLAVRRFGLDQELACDAAVLRDARDARQAYARAMLKTQLTDLGLPVGCHWQSSQPLKERIVMLKQEQTSDRRRRIGSTLAAAVAAVFALATYAAQPQHASAATGAGAAKPDVDVTYDALKAPVYPATAIAAKEQGLVVLDVQVEPDGSVNGTRLVASQPVPPKSLQDAALATVKTWRFNAARKSGKAIESWVRVPISFRLDGAADAPQYQGNDALDTIGVAAH